MKTHVLSAAPETVHWGFYDHRLEPVLTIASGDRLIAHTVSAHPHLLPADRSRVPKEISAIHAKARKGPGPHILLGPVAVEGAEPGDVLEVAIEEIRPPLDWGYNQMRAFGGALPEDFAYRVGRIIELDLKAGTAEVAPGWKIPLRPFFGQLAVSPPKEWEEIPSNPPSLHGGNLDNKELVAGSTLYLPVWKKGAGFSVGDGHGVQGDGEVNQTAVETSMDGTFRLTVRKDVKLRLPRAETPTHHITMGFDPDLDAAVKIALREMIDFLCAGYGLSREDAYVVCSAAVDVRITQVVNGNKGVHAMLAKGLLP
ncbi:MAG: acetamidase/formamidase family protein [Candidatus Tectomicrobia bacterium]|nr:acetamidase/formamidase family protein [Candidatus Tectomicrobia bacterium]